MNTKRYKKTARSVVAVALLTAGVLSFGNDTKASALNLSGNAEIDQNANTSLNDNSFGQVLDVMNFQQTNERAERILNKLDKIAIFEYADMIWQRSNMFIGGLYGGMSEAEAYYWALQAKTQFDSLYSQTIAGEFDINEVFGMSYTVDELGKISIKYRNEDLIKMVYINMPDFAYSNPTALGHEITRQNIIEADSQTLEDFEYIIDSVMASRDYTVYGVKESSREKCAKLRGEDYFPLNDDDMEDFERLK